MMSSANDDYLRMLDEEKELDEMDNFLSEQYGGDSHSEYEPSEDDISDSDFSIVEETGKRRSIPSIIRAAKRYNSESSDSGTSAKSVSEENSEQSSESTVHRAVKHKKLSRNEIALKIFEVQKKLSIGELVSKKRESKGWSKVWSTFEEIRDPTDLHKETQFVKCLVCSQLVYKPTSNTNCLLRHCCNSKNGVLNVQQEEIERLNFAAAQFVVKDLRPYYAVGCKGLLDLCIACMKFGQTHRKADRDTLMRAMPSRNTVKATVKDIARKHRQEIGILLKCAIETGGIAATTDTWQDDYRKATYIAVVIHIVYEKNRILQYKRFVLSTSEITELVKTGNVLIEHITTIFTEYGLSSDEVKKHVKFVSDRGSNIKYGLIRNGFKRITCYAHIIHNLVSKMLSESTMKDIVEKCAKLSSYVKNTGLNKRLQKSLKRYTTTRWNSVYIMIDCIIESFNEVYKLLAIKQRLRNESRINSSKEPDQEILELITVLNKSELEEIREFLEPFKKSTDELEGDKHITLHLVWTNFIRLKEALVASNTDKDNEMNGVYSITSEMKKLGRAYMEANKKDMEPTFEHKSMTFLTPSYKKLVFVNYSDRFNLHIEIENYIGQNSIENEFQNEIPTNTVDTVNTFGTNKFMSFDTDDEMGSEFERYLRHPIKSDVDSVAWWMENSTLYPKLYKMFKELSCIPASSASAERDFSLAGNIITDKRSMLLPENVNDLIVSRNVL